MDMLYLASGGAASGTYSVSSPNGILGTFVLLQFIDPVGMELKFNTAYHRPLELWTLSYSYNSQILLI
jgi:hypothetical protein